MSSAVRSPDGAFILKSRYQALPPDDREKFAHICPDFVIEILSKTDRLRSLHDKMIEWMDNGCRLAWMVNPRDRNTVVFSAGAMPTSKGFDEVLSGGAVLPGFSIRLSKYSYL